MAIFQITATVAAHGDNAAEMALNFYEDTADIAAGETVIKTLAVENLTEQTSTEVNMIDALVKTGRHSGEYREDMFELDADAESHTVTWTYRTDARGRFHAALSAHDELSAIGNNEADAPAVKITNIVTGEETVVDVQKMVGSPEALETILQNRAVNHAGVLYARAKKMDAAGRINLDALNITLDAGGYGAMQ